MSDSFNEAADVMGYNFAEKMETQHEYLHPEETMKKLLQFILEGKNLTASENPEYLQWMRSVARLTDDQIIAWINECFPKPAHPESASFASYLGQRVNSLEATIDEMKALRMECGKLLGLETKRPTVN